MRAGLAYQATGRGSLTDPLSVGLNPRGAVGYGATLSCVYRGLWLSRRHDDPFEVLDYSRMSSTTTRFGFGVVARSKARSSAWLPSILSESSARGRQRTCPAKRFRLWSRSPGWVIPNFDEMLDILRYFGQEAKVNAMRKAPASERSRLWREFYAETDPNKITPENEALNQYFGRIAAANARFTDEGVQGWRTDRGEVFITLGPPDESIETTPGTAGRVVRWTYLTYRLSLFFQDETGFGRLRLTPGSRPSSSGR